MRCTLVFASILVIAFVRSVAHADSITLKNNDRITGKIKTISGGNVVVTTDYAGDLTIKIDAIRFVLTDEPVAVKLKEGTLLEGKLAESEGEQAVEEDTETVPFALSHVEKYAPNMAALNPPPPKERERWTGFAEAGATIRSGNTDTVNYTASAGAARKGPHNRLTLNFFSAYTETDGELVARRYYGETKWRKYVYKDKMYSYLSGSAENDDGRKLDYRFVAGTGVGYDFIRNDKRTLWAEGGVEYAWERWAPFTPREKDIEKNQRRGLIAGQLQTRVLDLVMGNGNLVENAFAVAETSLDFVDPLRDEENRYERYPSARLAVSYEQKLFTNSTIGDEMVLLPALDDLGEFRLTNRLYFYTRVTKAVKLSLSLLSEYDSRADESNVEFWDHTFIASLRYDF